MGFLLKARTVIWGPQAATKAERNLIVKVDFFVMTFVCLMYFSNYLDRANLSNAYVSGMKESLNMVGSDYNNVNSLFTVGYTVGMLPQNLLLHLWSPRYLMAINCLIWGALTMCTSAAKNTTHLMVIRFFQGIAESSTFVGTHYILGCWYREDELGKRGAIFSSSAQVATIFSGVLQASIYKNLNGHAGLAGYQWLFIICGLITVPIALFGVLFFPDTPETTRARFLNAQERALAISRLPPKAVTHLDRSVFRRVLGRWRWYLLCLIWIVGGELESVGANALMALWMKSQMVNGHAKWTVANYNYYPSGGVGLAIVALCGTAMWTDYTKKRYQVNILIAACIIISAAIILAYPPSTGAIFFAFYLANVSYSGQASNFAWANEICRGDDQERSIVLASMNMASNAVNAWWPLIFFKASDAPRWRRGMISLIVLSPIMVILTCVAYLLQRRDKRHAKLEVGAATDGDMDIDPQAETEKAGSL